MKKFILLTVVLFGLFLTGCSDTSTKTPDGTIQLLFKNVKAGEMTAVKTLISSGYLDNFDANKLRNLFGSNDVTGIQAEVLKEKNQRATVLITLVTKSGNRRGNRPVALVFQDGGWKIDYSGMSWPSSLTSANY